MSDTMPTGGPTIGAAQDVLLKVDNLHTWFELRKFGFIRVGYVRAVDSVSFDLKPGEAIAIVGESGCGKSSLAKTILGLHNPTKGIIHFEGRQISSLTSKDADWYRAKVGYVMQDPYGALAPFMTVKRILEEPLKIHGVKDPQERMDRIVKAMTQLKMTPVDDFLSKFPHMLSGGQQQRVVIARAIVLGPRLIVADEPISMLDASVRVEILQLIRKLQKDFNLGLIYITHDLSTVRYFSERIFVMYGGKLVEQGNVDELLDNPKHPYTQALIDAVADPDADNAKVFRKVPGGEPPSLVNPPAGCRFHPRCAQRIDGLCDKDQPPHFSVGKDHHTMCWLYREGLR
jgi:peptide/nickel transport system ATP-binding protein